MKRVVVTAWVAFGIACQSASAGPLEPVWGKQACASCAMLVSDPHFAAQVLTSAGDHLYFDDIGCMASYLGRPKNKASRAWVRASGGQWLETELSHFSNGAKTPMDYGFEYSATGELSWPAVQAAVRERMANAGER